MSKQVRIAILALGTALAAATGVWAAGGLTGNDDAAVRTDETIPRIGGISIDQPSRSVTLELTATIEPSVVFRGVAATPMPTSFLGLTQRPRPGENAAVSGVIIAYSGDTLTIKTFQGMTYSTQVTPETSIQRGAQPPGSTELKVGETVMILSMDGGMTAFAIQNMGVLPALR